MQRLARRVVVLVGTRAASPSLVMPSIPRRGLAVHVPYREHSPLPFHPEALHMWYVCVYARARERGPAC